MMFKELVARGQMSFAPAHQQPASAPIHCQKICPLMTRATPPASVAERWFVHDLTIGARKNTVCVLSRSFTVPLR